MRNIIQSVNPKNGFPKTVIWSHTPRGHFLVLCQIVPALITRKHAERTINSPTLLPDCLEIGRTLQRGDLVVERLELLALDLGKDLAQFRAEQPADEVGAFEILDRIVHVVGQLR